MYKYVARRLAFALLTAFVVVSVTFLVVRVAPNTKLGALLAIKKVGVGSEEAREITRQYRRQRGLTGSLFEQYLRFMWDAARLDLGYSFSLERPVGPVLARALPRTLAYMLPGVLAAAVGGVVGGLFAVYGGRLWDAVVRVGAYTSLGVPTFVVGVVVAFAFQPHVDWLASPTWCVRGALSSSCSLPFMRRGSPNMAGTGPWRALSPKYLLPAGVLALGLLAGFARHTRNAVLDHRASDTAKMLRAKGAGDVTDARHALRNAALVLLSVSFAELMSVLALGAFVVESVFHIPGVAAYAMVAVYTRDFSLVVGTAVVFALVGVAGSLVQDLLYASLDPRVGE